MKTARLPRLLVPFILLLIVACKKEKQTISSGTYTGTFTVKYASSTQTFPTTIVLKSDNKYACTTRGSGKYSVEDGKVVFHEENFWTADFDWGLILSGEYNYTHDGTHLKIWKGNGSNQYEYNLERVSGSED